MSLETKYDHFIQGYAQGIIKWRWLLILLMIVLPMLATTGMQHFKFSTDYRDYFGPDNPQLVAFNEVQNVYSKSDNISFVIEHESGEAFNQQTFEMIREFTDEAWALPFASRVDSLANYQHTEAQNDDLLVQDLVPAGMEGDSAVLQKARGIALKEPLLVPRLVSRSGHVTAVNVTFELPQLSVTETPTAVDAARELRDVLLAKYPGHNVYMTGGVMMNNAFTEASEVDIQTLFPLMYLLIMVVMFIMLRSFTAVFSTLIVIMLSAGAALGLACYSGVQFTPPSMATPVIISTLAIADCIHLLITQFALMNEGKTKHEAIIESLKLNFMPILLTSITTALGFLSINFTDSPPMHDVANISATGVMIAFLLSVTLLPALMSILPVKPSKQTDRLAGVMDKFADFVIKRSRAVLIVSAVVTVGFLALIPLNETNDMFVKYFDDRIEFRQDTDFAAENLVGFYTMEFNLQVEEPGGINDPEYLKTVAAFKAWWEQNPKVEHVNTMTDVYTRLNKNMHGDDPAWYKLPEQRDLAAQYFLLYEMSLPYGLDINNSVNIDKSGTRFVVIFKYLKSKETRAIAEEGYAWLEQNAPDMVTYGVSPAVMFAYIAKRNIESMLLGMPFALMGISLILIFALRNLRLGVLSLVPNLVPMGVAFGVWALINGELNFTVSIGMGMTIGIVVDDTIHYLSKYLRAKRELGMDTEQAVRYAFRTVGSALTVTTLILVAGFLVLAQSAFLPNYTMAIITVLAITAALITDFFLLPALLLKFDKGPAK